MGRSTAYYRSHPEARRKKAKTDAKINRRPSQVKKRVALNKYNRRMSRLGRNRKGDNKDASHQGSKITGYVHQSRNRGDRNNSRGDRKARGRMGRRR